MPVISIQTTQRWLARCCLGIVLQAALPGTAVPAPYSESRTPYNSQMVSQAPHIKTDCKSQNSVITPAIASICNAAERQNAQIQVALDFCKPSQALCRSQAPSQATFAHTNPTASSSQPTNAATSTAKLRFSASKRLIYNVKLNKLPFLKLNGELLWHNFGNSYSAQLRYSAFGLTRSQTSQGKISAAGLLPKSFIDQYRKQAIAHFDTTHKSISFSDSNAPALPLLAGAQDRLSVILQLGAMLADTPNRPKPGTIINVQVASSRHASMQRFLVLSTETLNLPGGSVQGVKIECQPNLGEDQKIEVWLSPQLDWLPARIRITEANGDSADQQWRATKKIPKNL